VSLVVYFSGRLTAKSRRKYSLQVIAVHSNALSVSPISPNPRSESESNIQQEPVTIVYVAVGNPPYPLFYTPTPPIFSLLHPRFIPRTMLHTMAQRSSGVGSLARSPWQPYKPTLIASISKFPAPYLNTPISPVSTSPPHSTHPKVRHTHTSAVVTQRKPHQAMSLIGTSSRVLLPLVILTKLCPCA